MISSNFNREKLAWAAGFFDGEGTTSCSYAGKGSVVRTLKLSIPQIHREELDRFRDAVLEFGSVGGPYYYPNKNPIWRYQCWKYEHSQAIIAMLWTFLSTSKREQAANALLEVRTSMIAKPMTLEAQAVEYLRDYLCSLNPNAKLPPHYELSRNTGYSIGTIQRAMKRLRNDASLTLHDIGEL